jgi:hypothetical protein
MMGASARPLPRSIATSLLPCRNCLRRKPEWRYVVACRLSAFGGEVCDSRHSAVLQPFPKKILKGEMGRSLLRKYGSVPRMHFS